MINPQGKRKQEREKKKSNKFLEVEKQAYLRKQNLKLQFENPRSNSVYSAEPPRALELAAVSSSSEEGNGTPLQYSCLENPMDGGAW